MDFDDDNDDDETTDGGRSNVDENEQNPSQTVQVPPVIFETSLASPNQMYENDEENPNNVTGDSDDNSLSDSSSASSQSLLLNPNSSIDKLDLTAIALLKEIFPEETTDSLRKLHHKHVILNTTSSPVVSPRALPASGSEPNPDILRTNHKATVKPFSENRRHHEDDDEMRQPESSDCHESIPTSDLPDDSFLRLPKSVAVRRPRDHSSTTEGNDGQTYDFIQDLEMQALEQYHLAGTKASATHEKHKGENYVEYNTYVVDKHERWGLGMTLQEVLEDYDPLRHQEEEYTAPDPYLVMGHIPQYTVVRYGLRVIGFLSDEKKNLIEESLSNESQSPAEAAGIKCNDVVIGINGSAFLLHVQISPANHSVDGHSEQCVHQKKRIIQSMKDSPSPVVLHIRRRRERSSIEKIFSQRSANSLLDSTLILDSQRNLLEGSLSETEILKRQLHRDLPPKNALPSLESSSPALHQIARTPPSVKTPSFLHPLSIALARRKLIRPGEDQRRITRRLHQFNERARQYESSNSLRIIATERGGGKKGCLVQYFDPNDLQPDMAALMVFPQDGVRGGESRKQPQDNFIEDDEEINILDLPVSVDDDDKNRDKVEQNKSRNSIEAVANTPSTPSLPIDSPLIPMEYLQAFYGYEQAREIRMESHVIARSALENQQSPRRLFSPQQLVERLHESQSIDNLGEDKNDTAWIPLHGIRKALSARIVNTFVESPGTNTNKGNISKSRIAYTIWVYDLESRCEWYAPIRYWEDFSDLYDAALNLLPTNSDLYKELSISKLAKEPAVPTDSNSGWSLPVFVNSSLASPISPLQQRRRKRRNDEFDEARRRISQQLEEFLRELLGLIYSCDPLHQNIAEISLYVQSFLGVEAGLGDRIESLSDTRTFNSDTERKQDETEKLLKSSIQRYTWRVFLLHTMKAIAKDFVDAARTRGPKLHEIESIDPDMTSALKSRAMDELLQMQRFLDELVDLILDGCNNDLRSISKRREYTAIHERLKDEIYLDRIVRESVREQVEIEVYVPLRSVVSRLLVNGWRHEDVEVHYKIKELRKRPQGMFRIEKKSPSHWQSVARILKQGVGMSTLPCVKLRAIVDAAREISRLNESEHNGLELLGADEFLPVFIFCVIRAELERPCALSILLQTLCDRINRIGEIGYFVTSFEAAIAHIKEIDLTEDQEDMLSFLTVPLKEIPLNE
eukprot:CAMPEP_0197178146 /NCGR_PEP_ID=MMETSP1423-20130617/3518_1 /TAXON_ID=476441 /ORGANISM="Pseudo-nitzschia heimii, Strain UNC1101" /LENGTH=1195 /DNA_ID=CAMNT_0042627829 /DNA_START=187 /DNA_END=3774 /DNA_ORIENTATION=-